MRGNVVVAAAVFGVALVLAAVVLVLGGNWVAGNAMGRFEQAVQTHGRSVEQAGVATGPPINAALREMAGGMASGFDRHGKSVERAGETISKPTIPDNYTIKMQGPVALQQPLSIRGATNDGALPVDARIGK